MEKNCGNCKHRMPVWVYVDSDERERIMLQKFPNATNEEIDTLCENDDLFPKVESQTELICQESVRISIYTNKLPLNFGCVFFKPKEDPTPEV